MYLHAYLAQQVYLDGGNGIGWNIHLPGEGHVHQDPLHAFVGVDAVNRTNLESIDLNRVRFGQALYIGVHRIERTAFCKDRLPFEKIKPEDQQGDGKGGKYADLGFVRNFHVTWYASAAKLRKAQVI